MPTAPHREFAFVDQDYAPDKSPNMSFYDIDGTKIKVFQNGSFRTNIKIPKSTALVESKSQIQKVLDLTIKDLNINITLQNFTLVINPKQFKLVNLRMPQELYIVGAPKLYVYGPDQKLLSDEDVEKYLQMGAITIKTFDHTQKQQFRDPKPRHLSEYELEEKRNSYGITEEYESLPRTMFFRSSSKRDIKKQLFESLNSSNYVMLGKFNEGHCKLHSEIEQSAQLFATCWPSDHKTEEQEETCEFLNLEIGLDGCGQSIHIACTRLCKIPQLSKAVYDVLDRDLILSAR